MMYISATCQDGGRDVRSLNTTDLNDAEVETLVKRIEEHLCLFEGGVFKLHPRKEFRQ